MSISPRTVAGSARQSRHWVESMGGPLIAVPVSALPGWGGCAQAGGAGRADGPDDYDRACEVDGWAGVIAVGGDGAQALVLADEPARSRYLPEHRAFLRWLAADSEADLIAAAEAVLAAPATAWEECGTWKTDGAAVLMDSVTSGTDLGIEYPIGGGLPEQAPVLIPAGRWTVRAVHTEAGEHTWIGLVQLVADSA
ncbi:Imm21 family immunity protein [Streptomyces sp. NPDC050636]|uniref:Imm21 family immunity protein n=1 Tax=Streptomyces sp. NPDC050636 TaxID=3154510 RepID=UPI003444C6CB